MVSEEYLRTEFQSDSWYPSQRAASQRVSSLICALKDLCFEEVLGAGSEDFLCRVQECRWCLTLRMGHVMSKQPPLG